MGPYPARQAFFDKSSYPLKTITKQDGVRIVPGGSSIRDGSYIAKGVVCIPPMFINFGAYVDEGTNGGFACFGWELRAGGKELPYFAAAQIGGVLEPVGACL